MTKFALSELALSYAQPVIAALVICFWAFAPEAVVNNPWTIIVVVLAVTAAVLGLELVAERHPGWRMTWREFLTDTFYVVLGFTAIDFLSSHLAEEPLKAAKQALGISTPWVAHLPFLAQAALVLFLIEFGQYWMHRAMHKYRPFWLTHAPHHHITQLNAMKGSVGNPIELFLISLSVVALFDVPVAALLCGVSMISVVSIFAHANVRADPPRWYAFLFTTIRNHSLHHSVPYEDTRCNYANSLIVIDRVFGTYREGEAAIVGQDDRQRLSIAQQFAFPFVPVIDMVKSRKNRIAAPS